jgi:hypothetical protein
MKIQAKPLKLKNVRTSYQTQKENTIKFYEYILDIFKKAAGEVPYGKRYYAPSLHASPEFLDYLQGRIFPLDYVNIAPTEDETLKGMDMWIDEKTVFEDSYDKVF